MNEAAQTRVRERRIYLTAAILFPLIIFAGFARTYYLRGFFDTPPLASMLVHVHGVIMSAWVLLFITQVYLIRSRNVKLHMKLGISSIPLAVLIVIVGFATAMAQAARGGTPLPEIPPLAFLAVPFFDMVIFPILFGAAVYYRKTPANHKRLMLLTVFNFLPPGVARIPIAALTAYGPLWFFGFTDLIALTFLAVDTWRNKRLNTVFALGILLLIASHPLRIMLSGTEAWLRFAAWIVG